MARIVYIDYSGDERAVDVPEGSTVMRGAVDNAIPGIDGDCGGECSCATCHVYVDPEWEDRMPPMTRLEDEMLGFVLDRRENSRLSCRLHVEPEFDGLVVRTPESQY